MIAFILEGIDFKNPRLTRSTRIWFQYFCWCIRHYMMFHHPDYPGWIRGLVYKYYPHAHQRWSVTWNMVRLWQHINPDFKLMPEITPFPWWIGMAALGPLRTPWTAVSRWFGRHTGGRSHRCEFTDRTHGALYGGQDGGFMNHYFEQFIANISAEDAER